MSGKTLPNYLHVFEQRLGSIRNKLQDQLDLPKEKREKKSLKRRLSVESLESTDLLSFSVQEILIMVTGRIVSFERRFWGKISKLLAMARNTEITFT